MKLSPRTLIVDGNNAIWRAASTLPDLSTPRGEPIQVVYGFIRLLHDMLVHFEPDQVLVCWDEGIPKYRLSVYPNYKSHRERKRQESSTKDKKKRKDVLRQLSVVKEILPLLGVRQVSFVNTEGDDLIAAACFLKELGRRIVVSGDKDMFQLIKEGVWVWNPNHRKLYTEGNFYKHFRLTPQQYLEVQIIAGDMQGDCIPPAAPGLGEKTATELIQEYTSLENLFTAEVRKRVRYMGVRYNKLYEPSVQKNLMRNRKLIDLHYIRNRKQLQVLIQIVMCQEFKVKPKVVKEAFLTKAFSSLLKDFGTWIIPFKQLT